jgi:hypothetical protein
MSLNPLLEHVAEDLISCRLQEAKILVAKPKFDINGTDLLGFLSVDDGAKFCRIQCKGRSLIRSPANIKIPLDYVTSGFVVVLYLETRDDEALLCCFFEEDIKAWRKNSKDEYQLHLPKVSSQKKLAAFRWSVKKAEHIKEVIRNSNVRLETDQLKGSATIRFRASGTLTDANAK